MSSHHEGTPVRGLLRPDLSGATCVLGLLLLLIVLFFWDMFVGGKVPLMRDMFFDFLPQHAFAGEVFRSGHIPLWSTYSGWGKPFAGDPQTATFYPLHVFFHFLPASLALRLFCTVHLWIAGAGMFALARHWRMDVSPALVAATSCVFSSWMIGCLEFANNLASIVWCPLILLVTSKIVEALLTGCALVASRTVRLMVVLALLLAVQYLAGYPEFVAYTCALTCAYVLGMCISRRDFRALGFSVLAFALAGLCALLLTSPQLLLSWEFFGYSERAEKIDPFLANASFHPLHLLSLILPFINGDPGYPDKYWAGTIFEFRLGTCYVGLLPLVLAPFAMLWLRRGNNGCAMHSNRFLCAFLLAVAFFGLVMAFGKYTPLYEFLYKFLPGFDRFRFPARFLVLVLFALSMLAGFGHQAMVDSRKNLIRANLLRHHLLLWGAIVLGVLLLGYSVASGGPALFRLLTRGQFPPALHKAQLADYRICLLFTLTSLAVAYGLLRSVAKWADATAVIVVFANLFVVTREIQPMLHASVLEAKPDAVLRAVSRLEPYRVHSDYSARQEWLYGTRDEDLLEWSVSAGVGDSWLRFHLHQTWQGGMKLMRYTILNSRLHSLPAEAREKLRDVLGIRCVVAGAPFEQVFWGGASRALQLEERKNAQARAFLVRDWIPVKNTDDALKKLLEINPATQAIIEPVTSDTAARAGIPEPSVTGHADTAGSVNSLKDGANRMQLSVTANAPSLLVVNDAWYPGWKALVDGVARPIYRTNYHFRGVFVEPGIHTIEFIFDPPLFRAGLYIAGITSIVLIFLTAACGGQRKAASATRPPDEQQF